MQKTDHVYQAYCEVLRRELTAASGCTEPIALAYCAAKARQTLGRMPERVRVQVSGNIIKNVKSVTVPNTGGLARHSRGGCSRNCRGRRGTRA